MHSDCVCGDYLVPVESGNIEQFLLEIPSGEEPWLPSFLAEAARDAGWAT